MENFAEEPAIAYGSRYTLEDFLIIEWRDVRYEFWDGDLLPVAAATLNHNDIVFNINSSIRKGLKSKGCKSFQENVYLKLKQFNKVFLPDVIVSCKPEEIIPTNNFLENPTLIAEVLSDSTELYDRTKKWENYRRISSLRYYLIVSQKEYLVEMYHRPNEQSLFYFQSFEGTDGVISFPDLGFEISLKEIYEGILFESSETF